jgi:sugar phosphate isomerase/epimerase
VIEITRRHILAAVIPLSAFGASGMRLSLSARVAESFENKEKSSLTIDQLIALAKSYGYAALCMRASQAGTHTVPALVKDIAGKISASGLRVSMITGDFAVPRNDDHGPDGLRNITPYLDLAETFGADLIRICMKKDEDVAWAKRASREAAKRQIRLAHQSHCSSLFETVDGSLKILERVDEPNFGLIYEPANWMISGVDYGAKAIHRLAKHIFNVYVQNHRLNPHGAGVIQTWVKGPVRVDHIGLWERGGVDSEQVFAALRQIGYRGYVTVHQAFEGVMPVEDSVRKSRNYLRPLIS